MFTSGSTGTPKGVLNSNRMLAANQQMMQPTWPFLTAERLVIVDWLPWSHTLGGNHNLNMARQAAGRSIPVTGSWGATETGPAVTTAHSGRACDA